ncbi:MAG TPA: hypothetical protein DD435_05845 [Cyanobacteria bacterium UBA8530]|nr:hypothetical protein [Cyanobacteria bacterium UBA8530]
MKKIFFLSLLLLGCGLDPNGKVDPPSKAIVSPTPPLEEIVSAPESLPPEAPLPEGARLINGNDFSQFSDPIPPGKEHFFKGNWQIDQNTFEQSELGSGQALSIRRWQGSLPSHYFMEVACWPTRFIGRTPERIEKSVGVMAIMPYYRDDTHYLIMSARSKDLEAWAAEGFLPGVVWPDTNKMFGMALEPPIGIGGAISIGADVDLSTNTVKVFLNGQERGKFKLKPEFVKGDYSLALASNGSKVRFGRLRIYSLPGALPVEEATPSTAI